MKNEKHLKASPRALIKVPTGIRRLDDLTKGGLPQGRPTLVCGAAGCGKTLLVMEFIVRGARDFNEPGKTTHFLAVKENITERKRFEAALQQQTNELRAQNEELLRFHRVTVGRELRMIELKREVNELCWRLGEPPLHKIVTDPEAQPARAMGL